MDTPTSSSQALQNAPWNASGHWHADRLSLRQHVGNRKTTGPAHSRVANPRSGAMDAGKTGTPGTDQRFVSFDDRARRARSLREDLGGPGRCFGCSSVGALFGNRQETEQPARLAAATLGFLSKRRLSSQDVEK